MKVRDVMSRDVEVLEPGITVHEASRRMARRDAGAMPVAEDGRLVGMLTDRDVVVRVVAERRDPVATTVRSGCASLMPNAAGRPKPSPPEGGKPK